MPKNDIERLDRIIPEASPEWNPPRPRESADIARRLRRENLSLGITLGSTEGVPVFQFNEDRFRHTAVVGRTGSGHHSEVREIAVGYETIHHDAEGHWERVESGGHWE